MTEQEMAVALSLAESVVHDCAAECHRAGAEVWRFVSAYLEDGRPEAAAHRVRRAVDRARRAQARHVHAVSALEELRTLRSMGLTEWPNLAESGRMEVADD